MPDSFKDFATEHVGRGPNRAFMSFCQREASHAQLSLIFDDEFIEAYMHGIVILCCDGIAWRFYPCLFTHSADYPEKYAANLNLAASSSDGSDPIEYY